MLAEAFTAEKNPMVYKIFYQAHKDWDSAIMQLRLVLEPCSGTGTYTQIASMLDDGSGSTCKGTLRELADTCLGVFNGGSQRGYSSVVRQELLLVRKQEGPTEQLANLFLSKHSWCDDFCPQRAISNAVLRQLSGGNNLTAARKNGKEFVFKFTGQFFLACNGVWTPEERIIGSDVRRFTGLTFAVKFSDAPQGNNEIQKDASIKKEIRGFLAEWWFFANVFWLCPAPRAKSDHTEPKCPNTLALAAALIRNQTESCPIPKEEAEAYVKSKLVKYVVSGIKASSASEIDADFVSHFRHVHSAEISVEEARRALCMVLTYRPGVSLPACEKRKKTSVNGYVDSTDALWTLKPLASLGAK